MKHCIVRSEFSISDDINLCGHGSDKTYRYIALLVTIIFYQKQNRQVPHHITNPAALKHKHFAIMKNILKDNNLVMLKRQPASISTTVVSSTMQVDNAIQKLSAPVHAWNVPNWYQLCQTIGSHRCSRCIRCILFCFLDVIGKWHGPWARPGKSFRNLDAAFDRGPTFGDRTFHRLHIFTLVFSRPNVLLTALVSAYDMP